MDLDMDAVMARVRDGIARDLRARLACIEDQLLALVYQPDPPPWLGLALRCGEGDDMFAVRALPLAATCAETWAIACESATALLGECEVITMREHGRWAVSGGVA